MRPIFTIHAGEFVFGEEVQRRDPDARLWIPTKDTGVDFLITKRNLEKPVAVQVKMSRDYVASKTSTEFERSQISGGWFIFSHKKLESSEADIWSLVLISVDHRASPYFINIRPKEMLARLVSIHGTKTSYHLYPWVIRNSKSANLKCIEGRGLLKKDREALSGGVYELKDRDWSAFLDDWSFLT